MKYDYDTGLISVTTYGSMDQVTGTREWPWEDAPASLRLAIHKEALQRAKIQEGIRDD